MVAEGSSNPSRRARAAAARSSARQQHTDEDAEYCLHLGFPPYREKMQTHTQTTRQGSIHEQMQARTEYNTLSMRTSSANGVGMTAGAGKYVSLLPRSQSRRRRVLNHFAFPDRLSSVLGCGKSRTLDLFCGAPCTPKNAE